MSRAGPLPASARRAALALTAMLAVGALRTPPAAGDGEVQPLPPRIFFSQPDEEASRQIADLVDTSFGDVTKSIAARDLLVRRFGLWAVPPLLERIEAGSNEAVVRNAILTIATLRRTLGPSQHLWPAIRPLTAILRRDSAGPWRRAFAALALGTFYGPDTVRRGGASHEGTELGARRALEALVDANAALVVALSDANAPVAIAAALALGKIGGLATARAWEEQRKTSPPPAVPEARMADLLAFGLLGVEDDPRLGLALKDPDRRLRACGALAVTCWAVAHRQEARAPALAAAAAARAQRLDALLVPSQNVALRPGDWDGAEALFARAALALVSGQTGAFDDLYEAALTTSEARVAVAAGQGLLFAPAELPVRGKMAEVVGRAGFGRTARDPIVAAFLVVAGSDGSALGVRSCREYLRDKGREPRGRLEWDVRYYAALGLVWALIAGRVAPEARADAVDALAEGVRVGLPRGDGRTFRAALADVITPFEKQWAADPAARPAPKAARLLEAAFDAPDALTAQEPADVALARLNAAVDLLFGLDAIARAATGPPGARTPSRDDVPLRLLQGWFEAYPYFQRLDLLRDRGRIPVPPPAPGRDPGLELDR